MNPRHYRTHPVRHLVALLLLLLMLAPCGGAFGQETAPQRGDADTMLRQGLAALENGEAKAGYELVAPLALQGDPRAQYVVGLLYERGMYLPKSPSSARRWYTLAAEQGHAGAQNNLGLLLKSLGTEPELLLSYAWLTRAAMAGNAKARQNRSLVAAELTGAQVEAARRVAQDWWPKTWDELLIEFGVAAMPALPGQPEIAPPDIPSETAEAAPDPTDPPDPNDPNAPMETGVKDAESAPFPPAGPVGPLNVPISMDPGSADPLHEGGRLILTLNCYERLVENAPRTSGQTGSFSSELAPGLAESWKAEENSRGEAMAWVFTLRQGARFHNGAPVTADDVVYSLTRLLAPGLGAEHAGLMLFVQGAREYMDGKAESVAGLEVLDQRTVRIALHTPYGGFPAVLAHPRASILCREFAEDLGEDYGTSPETACGSGPYRLASWLKGERLVLERALPIDAAPDASRVPNEVRLHVMPEADKALALFGAGDIDLLDTGEHPSLAPQLPTMAAMDGTDSAQRLVAGNRAGLYYLAVNNSRPPFNSLLARKALQFAVDRKSALLLAGPGAELIHGVLPPGVRCYAPLPGKLELNQAVAREFLAQAGYSEGAVLRLTGVEGRGDPFASLEGLVVESAGAAGFRVEMERLSLAEFEARLARGELPAYIGEWSGVIDDPDAFFHAFFSSRGTVARSIRYGNGAMRTRVERAGRLADQSRRCEMYHQLGRIITQQDAAWLPLFAPGRSVLVGKRIDSLRLPWNGSSALTFLQVRMR